MKQFLKTRNRTMLELWTGIIFMGLVCEIIGVVLLLTAFSGSIFIYSLSLWTGIVMSLVSTIHMYRSLDKALDYNEGTAKKKIYASYMLRYFILVILFAIICITGFLNPVVAFLGYMMLKVGALIQPWTHKVYNKIFNETDPVPMTQEEYDAMRAAEEADSENEGSDGNVPEADTQNEGSDGNAPEADTQNEGSDGNTSESDTQNEGIDENRSEAEGENESIDERLEEPNHEK